MGFQKPQRAYQGIGGQTGEVEELFKILSAWELLGAFPAGNGVDPDRDLAGQFRLGPVLLSPPTFEWGVGHDEGRGHEQSLSDGLSQKYTEVGNMSI
jgi:hypothetical protein